MYVVTTYMSVTQMNKRVNANTSRIRPDPVIELYKTDIHRTLTVEGFTARGEAKANFPNVSVTNGSQKRYAVT